MKRFWGSKISCEASCYLEGRGMRGIASEAGGRVRRGIDEAMPSIRRLAVNGGLPPFSRSNICSYLYANIIADPVLDCQGES
jgi:hypothetical protein